MGRLATALLLATLFVGLPCAEAKEVRTAADGVLDALPAPSAKSAWEFSGYVLRDGRPYGKVSLSARPAPEREGHWLARDAITPRKPQDFTVLQTAVLDERLRARSGRFMRRNTRGHLHASFEASADGYRLEHESDYYENRLDVKSAPGLSTLAAVITFLRHAPAAKAVYRLRDFDPDPSAGDGYAMDARVQVHGLASWGSGGEVLEAWIASLVRGKQTLRLAFDPTMRDLIAVDYVGLGVQFVRTGHAPGGLVGAERKGLDTPVERAVARTAALRKRLGVPARPLNFLGDIRLGATRVGTVMLSAEPASVNGAPAWRVLESHHIKVGEGRIEHEVSGFLGQDLRALRGERIDKRPNGTFHVTFERETAGIRTVAHTQDGPQPPVVLGAPAGAMTGLLPVLLFLREVPAEAAHYVLPGWDPRYAQKPKAGTGTFTLSRSDVHLEVRGVVRLTSDAGVGDGIIGPHLVAHCERRNGESFDVYMKPGPRRRLVAVKGGMPRLDLRVRSTEPTPVDWYDAVDGVPTTWRQAFVKFGRGYHRPRKDLLADAFHWPSMVRHALAEKRYEPGTPEAKIRDEWIDVFVKMSKHRTKGDCDDLLFQIFMTSQEWQNDDGSWSLRTLPAYGGHTYRMQEIGDRWWIVKID